MPDKARRLVAAAVNKGEPVAVSSISLWEVAMLVARKRLALTIDTSSWIAYVEALPFLNFIPVDNQRHETKAPRRH